MPTKPYFASQLTVGEDLAKEVLLKIESVRNSRHSTELATRIHRNWLMYYGLNDYRASLGDNLYASGPNGERVELRANHYRNILQHMVQLATSTRPDLSPRAETMDVTALKQCRIARAVVDQYFEVENYWRFVDVCVEQAVVLHGGFIHLRWDAERGQPWTGSPETDGGPGQIFYQGDFWVTNPSLFDIFFDPSAVSWDEVHDLTVREWVNKWDLVAKVPGMEDIILRQKTKKEWDSLDSLPQVFFSAEDSVQVELFTFYHDRTPAVPMGRQTSFLSDGTVLDDGPLEYSRIPVFRIAAAETMGTPHAWSPATDLASLQEAVNKGISSIATNQFAFGVQSIWAPRGSRLDVTALTGGLNLLEGSPVGPNGGKPEVLQLLNTPKELFEFIDMEIKMMETISGVNQVIRGNPEAGLTAGVALALISTQSLQFMSPLNRSYAECARDVAKFILDTLKQKATTPRMLHIVGQTQREALKWFTNKDIDSVTRVTYELGNPMTRTPAGRMQLVQSIIESGTPLTPQQVLEVIDKGRLEPITDDTVEQLDNIFLENEDLMNGVDVPVLVGDDDVIHLQKHICELQNPDIRRDILSQQPLMRHIAQHVQKHMGGDIIRGIVTGMIPPPYGAPAPAEGEQGGQQQGQPGQPPGKPGQPQGRQPPPEKKPNGQQPPQPQLPRLPAVPNAQGRS